MNTKQSNKSEKHKRAFIIWLAIYPLITGLYYCLGNLIAQLPLPVKTLILTSIAVPIMFYLLVPGLNQLLRSWLGKTSN
ncbi:hypothetical protein [Reichenbachiella faecimaris]|uniref:hypothetical protein n=1 Tax=Reichenbachiella faecimaris TaxID=692418 RepID=UPI00111C35AF|nr:hypothetical protein [Reichenbachiella faecimaris]